jgi:hypothetical protein
MNISDTTKLTTRKHIYQVISSSNVKIYYFIIKYKITTSLLYICRIMEYLYHPRVKMHDDSDENPTSYEHVYVGHQCMHVLGRGFKKEA